MNKLAISVGDINGVGIEIILKTHNEIQKKCEPIYCIHKELMKEAIKKLNIEDSILDSMKFINPESKLPKINPGLIKKDSGLYSFNSFKKAVSLAESKQVSAIVTLPIHKAAWLKAGVKFIGHTDFLSKRYKKDAIMMLGCEKMFVALFSDHIALNKVSKNISIKKYKNFLLNLQKETNLDSALVLGFNPHCGDNGAIGGIEDNKIQKALKEANKILDKQVFKGVIPPDSAFIKQNRENFKFFVAPYHDIGLATLKALYFDESINVSLNIPIIRTSVDHGTAYDLAYTNNKNLNTKSYLNAIDYALKLIKVKNINNK